MKRLAALLFVVCVLVWAVDGDAQRRLNRAGRGTPTGSGDPLRGVVGQGVSAPAGCSGSYGNQSEVNGGSVGDGSTSECFVKQITGACNGNLSSISARMTYFGTSTGYRYEHVLYTDNAGSPGTLIDSIDSTATGDVNGPAWNVGTKSIATGSTTFWAGVCKEGTANMEYQATTGGTTRTVYNCSSAYSSPPSTWGSGCTVDGDYNSYNLEIYVTY